MLQPLPPNRSARIARALHIRIQHLLRERVEKAGFWEKLERWHRAEQEQLLDEIMIDSITLRRMRSLIHSLQFEGGAS